MKRFIVKLILFLTPIAGLIGFIAYRVPNLPNTYNLKKIFFEEQVNSTEVLVLGNSHAAWGIDPANFSHRGFNLANIAQSFYYDKELTLKYISRMPKLKVVIITTSYFSLYYTMDRTNKEFNLDVWRAPFYYKFWGIKSQDDTTSSYFNFDNFSMLTLYYTEEAQKFVYNYFKPDNYYELYPNGYMQPLNATANLISDSNGKQRVELFNAIINSPGKNARLLSNIHDLVTLITTLRNRNIQVVILDMPVYRTCSKYYDKKVIAYNNTIIDSLCTGYNCKFFDYSNDTRFIENEFYDNDHLNHPGAEHFSKIIEHDIIKPLIN